MHVGRSVALADHAGHRPRERRPPTGVRALGVVKIVGIVVAASLCDARPATAGPQTATSAPAPASSAPAPGARPSPPSIDALGAPDRRDVERAVAAITDHAAKPDAELLFAAARACEDKLDDPGRAAAIYKRIVAAFPDARVALPAARRLDALRPRLGAHGETAGLAAELAQLIARADELPAPAVLVRGAQLADGAWAGAPDAALWLASWLRRTGRLVEV